MLARKKRKNYPRAFKGPKSFCTWPSPFLEAPKSTFVNQTVTLREAKRSWEEILGGGTAAGRSGIGSGVTSRLSTQVGKTEIAKQKERYKALEKNML